MLVWFAVMQAFFILLFTQIKLTNTAKTRDLESRFNTQMAATAPAVALASTASTSGGNVTFSGDVHIDGSLFGSGGTLEIGDTARFNATGNGPSGSNTFLGMTNSQASFLDTLQQAGGVTAPTTTWGGGAGCSLSTGNFNSAAITGLNQVEGAVNELITALVNMGLLI
jgi:hypothetical protein